MIQDPLEFGQQLLNTGDLDPVYIALHHAQLPTDQLQRLCVAYWCYYHLGVAALVSEYKGEKFWQRLERGLATYPRGTERRHFRGQAAESAVHRLQRRFPRPETLISYLQGEPAPSRERSAARGLSEGPGAVLRASPPLPKAPRGPRSRGGEVRNLTFEEVVGRAVTLPLFGPWIAFKIADMLERVLSTKVDFTGCDLLALYEAPLAGATLAGVRWNISPQAALTKLTKQLAKRPAPPDFGRPCGIQEAETVLCKWKSHLNGHYPIGKDILEVAHGLMEFPWVTAKTATNLHHQLEANTALPTLRRKTLV